MAEVTIRGLEELLEKFDKLGAFDILRDPMQRAMYRLQRDMADYPPAPRASTYVRTGTLGRRWTTQVPEVTASSTGLVGRIGNTTVYAPFVQSAALQRRSFRGRWQTDEQALKRNERAIIADFERAIEDVFK